MHWHSHLQMVGSSLRCVRFKLIVISRIAGINRIDGLDINDRSSKISRRLAISLKGLDANLGHLVLFSSIHVYHFCLHVVHICSTWMTSCMQFEKIEG